MEKTKRKRGRPRTDTPRTARIYVSYTEAEVQALEAMARELSLPLSILIRTRSLSGLLP